MTYQDFVALNMQCQEWFADGAKPTYAQWESYAQLFTAALNTGLDSAYAKSALSNSGFKTGATVTNAMMVSFFEKLFTAQSAMLVIVPEMLTVCGFNDGDKPTSNSFSMLTNIMACQYTSFTLAIQASVLSGYNSGSSLGIDAYTFSNSYQIANSNNQGNYLSPGSGGVYDTGKIDLQVEPRCIGSFDVTIKAIGCTFNYPNYIDLVDSVNNIVLNQSPIIDRTSTSITGSFDIYILSQSTSNNLTFLIHQ